MPLSAHPPGAKGKTFHADSFSHGFCIRLLYMRRNGLLLLEEAQTVHNKTFPASHRMKNDGWKKATLSSKPSRVNCDRGYF